jgi:PAS domain S-box-containing protein
MSASDHSDRSEPPENVRGTVLVVDDEDTILTVLKNLLTLRGHRAVTASDAQQALSLFGGDTAFDAILTDIRMPGQTGLDLLAEIRRSDAELPILVMTGYGEYQIAVDALRKGATDYLEKPFSADELFKSLERSLEIRRLRRLNRDYQQHLEQMVAQRTAELAVSEERYRALVENSSDIFYSLDNKGDFTFANEGIRRTLGYDPRELEGTAVCSLLHPDDLGPRSWNVRERRRDQRADRWVEVRFLTHNGKGKGIPPHRVLEVKARGVYGENGRFLGTEAIARDMTERKDFEEKLSKQAAELAHLVDEKTGEIQRVTQLLKNILQSAEDFFILSTDPEGIITSVNEGARKILGYSPREVVDKASVSILEPESEETHGWFDQVTRTVLSRGRWQGEKELRRASGEILPARLNVRPLLDQASEMIGYVLIGQDITEQKNIEEQILRSERLAAAGRLAAGLAHEINNPLYGIRNAIEILTQELPEKSDRRHLVDLSLKEIDRISLLLAKMLDFYRPSEEERKELDINQLLDNLLTFMSGQLTSHGIEIVRELADKSLLVSASSGQLEQVFMNLFTNARTAMPSGGKLTVRTRKSRHSVVVEIGDTGVGIEKEHLPHIFDAFYSTHAESKHSGLGLSVSDAIIRSHGGKIEVRSVVGKGTTFSVWHPLIPKKDLRESSGESEGEG